MKLAAQVSLGAAIGAVILLAALHVLSPEFDPSWRMVSEYANGGYGWLLSLFFLSWAVSSWALAYALRPYIATRGGRIGLVFLALAGVGEAMAAAFDINHGLHSAVSFIGILSLPVAALLISRALGQAKLLAHATWLCVILMMASFGLLISTYLGAGGSLESGSDSQTLPDGVIALVGWANRLLVIVFSTWVAVMAWRIIQGVLSAPAKRPSKRAR